MPDKLTQISFIELASDIVAAYVSKNSVPQAELPTLIVSVYTALNKTVREATEAPKEELKPAVPIKKSMSDDYLICLDDGKKFKSLKRHLRTKYNLTPDEYRARWNLPSNYPMVAPNYAQARSALAKTMGLGQKRTAARKRSKKAA